MKLGGGRVLLKGWECQRENMIYMIYELFVKKICKNFYHNYSAGS